MSSAVELEKGIFCRIWKADSADARGSLVLIHGFGDHSEYQLAVTMCRPSDCACVAIDLPGHGLSAGPRGHIDNWTDYERAVDLTVAYARQNFGDKVVVWGSSLGGLLALSFATRDTAPVAASAPMLGLPIGAFGRCLINIGAALSPVTTITINTRPQPGCHGLCSLGWLRLAATACDRFRNDAAARFQGTVLIQVGTKDPLVSLADVEALKSRCSYSEDSCLIQTYAGAAHEPFIVDGDKASKRRRDIREVYLRDLRDFIQKNL